MSFEFENYPSGSKLSVAIVNGGLAFELTWDEAIGDYESHYKDFYLSADEVGDIVNEWHKEIGE